MRYKYLENAQKIIELFTKNWRETIFLFEEEEEEEREEKEEERAIYEKKNQMEALFSLSTGLRLPQIVPTPALPRTTFIPSPNAIRYRYFVT